VKIKIFNKVLCVSVHFIINKYFHYEINKNEDIVLFNGQKPLII